MCFKWFSEACKTYQIASFFANEKLKIQEVLKKSKTDMISIAPPNLP